MINVAALIAIGQRRDTLERALLSEKGHLVGLTIDTIRAIESVKASGLEQAAFARWAGYQAKVVDAEQRLAASRGVLELIPMMLGVLATAAILGLGGVRVMDGAITVGTLVAILALMVSFMAPMRNLVAFAGAVQRVRADVERADDMLRRPRDAAFTAEPATPRPNVARLSGAIELRDVRFGFERPDQPFIANLSLSVAPGTRVALVGANGSGKTTLGRIICGLYQPWSGEVLYDGLPIRSIPRELFAASVAYVDQDIFLFDGTLRNNLTLWDADVGDVALTRVLEDAAIHADVVARSGRYDCSVREGGTNFSAGQRQRLELARALAGDPAVLVLDEATAALEPALELKIEDALRRRGVTVIMLAHRLSTIRDYDEIVVLDRGVIAGRGRHEDLLRQCKPYASLMPAE
jgi:ABC-type bacteriocin/lantibiotic exporter with double-glycine peptidase domain